jgi:hypothetical protein
MTPANDNGEDPEIRFEGLESPPVCVVEVEIFDQLISTLRALAGNDNETPPARETKP